MIDSKTVTAIVTALGQDPTNTGLVIFLVPSGHALEGNGAVAAALGIMGDRPPAFGINASGKFGFGATAEDAAKALFAALQSDASTAVSEAAATSAAKAAAKTAIDAAVAVDATAVEAILAPVGP